jgi:hypothetical protein
MMTLTRMRMKMKGGADSSAAQVWATIKAACFLAFSLTGDEEAVGEANRGGLGL